MTKQEKIRKEIDAYADGACLYPDRVCEYPKRGASPYGIYCTSGEDAYKCLMKHLDKLGLVLKVERELSDPAENYIDDWLRGYRKCMEDMAGYVAVKPLVEEVKHDD